MHVHKPLVGVEKPALDALACRHAIFVGSADELLHIRRDVSSSLSSGVGAVEAILAEEVLALLALHHRRLALALLAHHDTRGFPDDVYLILFFADLPQELHRVVEILHYAGQVEFFLHVRLHRLLDTSKKKVLLRTIYPEDLPQGLNYRWRRRRLSLGCTSHDLCGDRRKLDIRLLQKVCLGLPCFHPFDVAPRLVVDLLVTSNERVLRLKPAGPRVVVALFIVLINDLAPVWRQRSPRGFLCNPEVLRLVDKVDADHLRNANNDICRVRARRCQVRIPGL
mmetsp:Transcript_61613/g.133373  ORF Transcript_61613/g.133373 Transcript_61613/m.133373 type:complete len:281 (+) Transcript_61613:499-1341(+)